MSAEAVRLPVYLLAGGRSARFGADKARALLDGEPLIAHVARALAPHASRVTVVAERAGKHDDLGLRTIADDRPHLGPLGGLRAALADLAAAGDHAWLLLAACDTLGWDPAWMAALVEELPAAEAAGRRAVAYRDTRWQPLPALYHRDLLPACDALLEGEHAPLRAVLERGDALALPTPAGWSTLGRLDTADALRAWAARRPR